MLQTDYKIKFVRARFPMLGTTMLWEPQPAVSKEQQFSQRYAVPALNRRNITTILPDRDLDLKYSSLCLDA
ncbi:hypothetical protein NIES267_75060 (plasmid) [Calothrix parasitica NIES-267]|uniref:Uncharacterized protein n=1 Tax=Calothrix parasitica NIES-267 TaxID=1973488 RepID=A0A1Z4M389_9CYAN|nr:hypothetical protein NIES267_75060 [Calothrix parasitica NIES-267]